MLGPPNVVPPISPCSSSVHVQGQQPGNIVEIWEVTVDSQGNPQPAMLLGTATASWADEYIPLAVQPAAGTSVSAKQVGSQGSSSLGAPTVVFPNAQQGSLAAVTLSTPVYASGGCVFISGAYPGATVTIYEDGAAIGSGPAADGTAQIFLNTPVAANGAALRASQTCQGVTEANTLFPNPLAPPKTLPAPTFTGAVVECSWALPLANIVAGAIVTVTLGADASTNSTCCPAPTGNFILWRALVDGEEVTVSQELPGQPIPGGGGPAQNTAFVAPLSPVPVPNLAGPLCVGTVSATVTNLVPGAEVDFYLYDANLDSVAPLNPLTFTAWDTTCTFFNVGPLVAGDTLRVGQVACGVASELSDGLVISNAPPGAEPAAILAPVYACARGVRVVNLVVGDYVVVTYTPAGQSLPSPSYPLCPPTRVTSTEMDVFFATAVVAGDTLYVQSSGCFASDGSDFFVQVETYYAGGDFSVALPRPILANPTSDCGGSVRVSGIVPGAQVVVYIDDGGGGQLYGSAYATQTTVDVAPNPARAIKDGETLWASQSLCGASSAQSEPVSATTDFEYATIDVVPVSQLCGERQTNPLIPFQNTGAIDLPGEDLGVPVEFGGRLYLFFGDERGNDHNHGGGHPIAFTTSQDPESGPPLTYLTDSTGDYLPCNTHELPPTTFFEGPTGGFSFEDYLYVFRMGAGTMPPGGPLYGVSGPTRSYLIRSTNPQDGFDLVSQGSAPDGPAGAFDSIFLRGGPTAPHFVNCACATVRNSDWPGLPPTSSEFGVFLWGTGNFRGSNVWLAWAPLSPAAASGPWSGPPPNANEWYFCTSPSSRANSPPASPGFVQGAMSSAGKLLGPAPTNPSNGCFAKDSTTVRITTFDLGELSVTWESQINRWVMMYQTCSDVPGPGLPGVAVVLRTSQFPWGPWSAPVLVFPNSSGQVGADRFIGPTIPGDVDDSGSLYAPYVISRYTRWDATTRSMTLYFTMSTWVPYVAVLMKATLACA
jgi:hypothetical protein